MRFKRLDTHEHENGKSTSSEKKIETESKSSLIELGESSEEAKKGEKPALPIEWKSLAPFIETERSRKPSREYLEGFWGRLLPRLKRAIKNDLAVREYLRQTFWSRWAMRAAATATILSLLVLTQIQRSDMQTMREHLNNLENQIRSGQAGM